jgi:hypothetical protein
MQAFLEHIRTGHSWTERWPRRLLWWAAQHRVPTFGHKRFLIVLLAGFDCPERWRLWGDAAKELRRSRLAIKAGEETGMAHAGGRELLALSEGAQPRWGTPESVLRPSLHASLAGPMPETNGATTPSPPSIGSAIAARRVDHAPGLDLGPAKAPDLAAHAAGIFKRLISLASPRELPYLNKFKRLQL